MVKLSSLSFEHRGDRSPLMPEAAKITVPTHFNQKPNQGMKADYGVFFLSRTQNLSLSLVLLIGCYSAILIPAYYPPYHDYPQTEDRVLLNLSASLLAAPCQPRWCLDHLKPLPGYAGLVDIPVFVQQEDTPAAWDLSPPLGLQGSEKHLALALASLPQPGLPPSLRREGKCRRCVVVGSGGVLHGSRLGSHIDQYDVIIRLNNAPVMGFQKDAGSRTTIRLTYPEGAPYSPQEYKDTNMVALVVFKSLDLEWLTSIIIKQPLSFWSKLWFWREVVEDIPLTPESFRIFHPEIIRKTGAALQTYSQNPGRIVPTLGASAVVMALQLCDQVSLAGFGYDLQHPKARLHYYETIHMGAMNSQVVHDVSAEKLFLKDLVAEGAVADLTGAL